LEILTWYFGILGGLLTVLFLGTVWYWMRYSRLERGPMRKAGHLKVVGYGFLMLVMVPVRYRRSSRFSRETRDNES